MMSKIVALGTVALVAGLLAFAVWGGMFRLRYAYRLWCVTAMPLRLALGYPCPIIGDCLEVGMSPEECADVEISYMAEGG